LALGLIEKYDQKGQVMTLRKQRRPIIAA